FKLAAPVLPHVSSIFQQVLIEDGFDCRDAGSTGNRVATEGRTVISRGKQVTPWPGQHRPDRNASRQAFRHRHNIRYDIIVFPTEELPGSSHSSLDLVTDHYQVALVTPLTYALYKLLGTRPDAAFTLYSLL